MRILVVDDSALFRSIIKQVLSEAPDLTVVGEASNGKAGLEAVKQLKPDLVILDIDMPLMNGIEATRAIMAGNPCPILIFSTMVSADTSFQACQAGALDVMAKPDISQYNNPEFLDVFFSKIRLLGSGKSGPSKVTAVGNNLECKNVETVPAKPGEYKVNTRPVMIVMGASTGGPKAVRTILSKLPGDLPVPVVLVQHLESGFDQGYCDWLNESSELNIQLVRRETRCEKGAVYIAPNERHIVFNGKSIVPDDGAKVLNQKPSVDVLFNSAAKEFGNKLLGILLTGMGSDGAAGCLNIIRAGGTTLVQDEATSAIYGMPKEAVKIGGASYILPLEEISQVIRKIME